MTVLKLCARVLPAALLLVGVPAAPALAQAWGPPLLEHRDARQMAPPALMGIWRAENPNGGGIFLRSFSYTEDGKVMVSFMGLDPKGVQRWGHWSLQLDGTPGQEYRSDGGAASFAVIRLTKVDDRTFHLTNTVGGVVQATSVWTLSGDGQMLTMARTPTGGALSTTVYRRWSTP
jgi:hypothetical protein